MTRLTDDSTQQHSRWKPLDYTPRCGLTISAATRGPQTPPADTEKRQGPGCPARCNRPFPATHFHDPSNASTPLFHRIQGLQLICRTSQANCNDLWYPQVLIGCVTTQSSRPICWRTAQPRCFVAVECFSLQVTAVACDGPDCRADSKTLPWFSSVLGRCSSFSEGPACSVPKHLGNACHMLPLYVLRFLFALNDDRFHILNLAKEISCTGLLLNY
jgi:hypothetical protein